jgi:hypothetical protein
VSRQVVTPTPDAGTTYPSFRTSGDWGSVAAARILISVDRQRLTFAGSVPGRVVPGEGWTLDAGAGLSVASRSACR